MLKGPKKFYAIITCLRNAVNVYFGQFLVFYFFTVANYDIKPIATYYIFEYLFLGIGFYFIRHAMKSNNRLTYYRIGIALQALYLSLVMILKENIIHFAPLVGLIYGLSEGFYYFPHNLMESTLIKNEERKKFNGFIQTINNLTSIVLPLIVGYFLMYFSYVEIAKVVFFLMLIIFALSYGFSDEEFQPNKSNLAGFWNLIKKDKVLQQRYLANFLAGLTFSCGALSLVVTVFTIFEFKTSLNLGIITSLFAILTCLTSYFYGAKLKEKSFQGVILISTILYSLSILIFGISPSKGSIVFYQFCNAICLHFMNLIFSWHVSNLANKENVSDEFRTEYFLTSDLVFAVARVSSYLLVLFLVLVFGVSALQYSFFFFSFIIFFFGMILLKMIKNK